MPDAAEQAVEAPAAGTLLSDRYRVERVLGAGGMSVVVAAQDTRTGTRVAVKLMRTPGELGNERILREARALASLESEHITRLLDSGTLASGEAFLVTELVDGNDLGAMLAASGPLPVDAVVDITMQACAGLAEAHARGVVHRDIKPGNVIVTTRADGTRLVKLVDFGVSRSPTSGSGDSKERTLTKSDHLLGTPHYMAPEQIKNAHTADARADVYSLGALMFRLLTGDYPFEGDTAGEVIINIASMPTPSAREKRPDVPVALDAIIRKCLSKSPTTRMQSARELSELLASISDESPTSTSTSTSTPASTATSTAPPKRTSLSTRTIAIALAAAVTVGGAAIALRPRSEAPAFTDPRLIPSAATLRGAPSPTAVEDAQAASIRDATPPSSTASAPARASPSTRIDTSPPKRAPLPSAGPGKEAGTYSIYE